MEADKEPICLIDLWRVSLCGSDCNIAVIPQELQGATLQTRCVGFKHSNASQSSGKKNNGGFLEAFTPILALYLKINAHFRLQ